jgi:excisionase family DNA binding protein
VPERRQTLISKEEEGMEPALLNARQVAAVLGVSRQAIERWTRQGHLTRVKLARCTRYPRAEIEGIIKHGLPPDRAAQP